MGGGGGGALRMSFKVVNLSLEIFQIKVIEKKLFLNKSYSPYQWSDTSNSVNG